MSENINCPRCGEQLTGVVEVTSAIEGNYVFVVQRETEDCNWVKCMGCRKVYCKECRRDLRQYCCNEGRIVDRERARAKLADSDSSKSAAKKEVPVCPITKSFT